MVENILVVDDSRVSRMLIRTIINHVNPDATVIEAKDGKDALAKIEATNITMATVDLNMPGDINGLDLASELRGRFLNAKISLLTANIQEAVKQKAEKIGIGFIPKPITEEKILAFLNS